MTSTYTMLLFRPVLAMLVAAAAIAGCAGESSESGLALSTSVGPDGIVAGAPGGPLSASVCIKVGDTSCYCTGVGCRRICNDVIVLSGGGNSSETAVGQFAGIYPGYPGVRIGSALVFDKAAAIAVVGLESDIEAGKARIVVKDSRDATLYDRSGPVADVHIKADIHTVTMDFLGGLLDPQSFTFQLTP